MNTKQDRETRLTELVETHNIAKSLKRLRDAPGFDDQRWRRAFLHALMMSGAESGWQELKTIREALKIP